MLVNANMIDGHLHLILEYKASKSVIIQNCLTENSITYKTQHNSISEKTSRSTRVTKSRSGPESLSVRGA